MAQASDLQKLKEPQPREEGRRGASGSNSSQLRARASPIQFTAGTRSQERQGFGIVDAETTVIKTECMAGWRPELLSQSAASCTCVCFIFSNNFFWGGGRERDNKGAGGLAGGLAEQRQLGQYFQCPLTPRWPGPGSRRQSIGLFHFYSAQCSVDGKVSLSHRGSSDCSFSDESLSCFHSRPSSWSRLVY